MWEAGKGKGEGGQDLEEGKPSKSTQPADVSVC